MRCYELGEIGGLKVVLTPEILDELEQKPREKGARFTPDQAVIEEWIAYIKTFTEVVGAVVTVEGVCRDQDDDMFLTAALSAKADYTVSADRDLHALGQCQDVKVVSPGAFADLLRKSNPLVRDHVVQSGRRCLALQPIFVVQRLGHAARLLHAVDLDRQDIFCLPLAQPSGEAGHVRP